MPGHPGRKTADLPENPGLPYQAARRPVKVREPGLDRAVIDLVFPRDARRDARRFAAEVASKRQPAPKSAPVSQGSKRRGGSSPPPVGGFDVHRREDTPFPRVSRIYPINVARLCMCAYVF